MKEKYVAPTISIEHYELTQSIAACATKIGAFDSACVSSSPNAPGEMKDLANAFYFSSGYCLNVATGTSGTDGICYHTSANAAFSS